MQWSSNVTQIPQTQLHDVLEQEQHLQQSNDLLMNLLQQMQQKDCPKQPQQAQLNPMTSSGGTYNRANSSDAHSFEQLFQQMHLRQNSHDNNYNELFRGPSNQMLFGGAQSNNWYERSNSFYDQLDNQTANKTYKRLKQVS